MKRLILTTLLLLCVVVPVHARPIPSLEGLEALRKLFTGISDFSAEMTQEKRLSLMKRTMTMNGIVRFRKPDLFYLEIVSPYASRMLLRDNTVEQVMGSGGDRNRIVLPSDQGLKRWFSRLAVPISSVPEGMTVQAEVSGPLYTVTITPQGSGQIRDIVISFLEDGTLKRLVIVERNGDRASMIFRKIRRNTGLTDKDFKLD